MFKNVISEKLFTLNRQCVHDVRLTVTGNLLIFYGDMIQKQRRKRPHYHSEACSCLRLLFFLEYNSPEQVSLMIRLMIRNVMWNIFGKRADINFDLLMVILNYGSKYR